jgi:hypothetical protein
MGEGTHMWIVADDVRSGQRMAFPLFSSIVSFDIERYRDKLQNSARLTRYKCANAIDNTICQIKEQLLGNAEDMDCDEIEEQLRHIEAHERPKIEQALGQQADMMERQLARVATVEAVILFNEKEFPVRSIRLVTSYDDLEPETTRTPKVDTKNLPPIDPEEG